VVSVVFLFAGIGLFLTAGFVALKLGLTKTAGKIDLNDRYFQNLSRKPAAGAQDPAASTDRILIRLSALHELHPQNAKLILAAFGQHRDPVQAERMLDALEPYLANDPRYRDRILSLEASAGPVRGADRQASLYPWMNSEEWQAFSGGVLKDRDTIIKAAKVTGTDPRLIVTMMVSEQIRLFTAQREIFKRYFAPLKVLGNETTFSLGVCGIKDDTAKAIEANLRNPKSPFYLGERYAHLLDYPEGTADADLTEVRYQRLIDRTHYNSYLYTGLYIRQIIKQWQAAGYDIADRPEILATLFNIGFVHSVPNPTPHVGGAEITVGGKTYTFGSLAFEFYYSGDMAEAFPLTPIRARMTDPVLLAEARP
jgi:hypothetical protein